MKKISAVLLVLVLVGSVVFAGFTGSATTSLAYNLQTGVYGFTNAKALDIDVVISETLGSKKGEGAIYAEIMASVKLMLDSVTIADGDVAPADLDYTAAITSAKIYGDGWWVNILGTAAPANWATSAIEADAGGVYATLAPQVPQNAAGVTVGLDTYTFSVGLTGDAVAGTYNVYGTAATSDMEIADGMKAKFAAAGSLTQLAKSASVSAVVDYAAEDYSAKLAADAQFVGGAFDADVAIKSVFAPATVDVYFATKTTAGPSVGVLNLLSAKVALALDDVTLTVTGKDLINAQDLSVSAKLVAEELAVTARGGYKVSTAAWNVGADVVYTAADYTATLNTTYASAGTLALTVKAESTKLVNNATLCVSYVTADIMTNKGAITTSAKIAF